MIPGYRYRYTPTDTDTGLPISQIFPYRTDNRYRVHTDIFHTDTDTGYRYLVSVSVYRLIPGIGRTLPHVDDLLEFEIILIGFGSEN